MAPLRPGHRLPLAAALHETLRRFEAPWVPTDPLSFPLHYRNGGSSAQDLEVVAFYASALAYGGVQVIHRNLADLFRRIGQRPARFVLEFHPGRDGPVFRGFSHRFHKGPDLALLTWLLRQALERHGGLEALFAAGDEPSHPDVGPGLARFAETLRAGDVRPLLSHRRLPPGHPVRHFLPSPADGSACKRLCLFLRWMVRPHWPDLGLWTTVSPRRLVVPLDTHLARLGRYLGLTRRRSGGWKTATDITDGLRRIDPHDPLRFDFSLAHLGMHHCRHRPDPERCPDCPLHPRCQLARPRRAA